MTYDLTLAIDALDELEAMVDQIHAEAPGFLLREVAGRIREKVVELAHENLESSKDRYLAGLQPIEEGVDEARLVLEGDLPVMVEEGADAYDMRDTLLEGAGHKAIRFRSKSPNASFGRGRDFGRPIDFPYRKMLGEKQARRVGKQVMKELRSGRSKEIAEGTVPKLKEHHATDLFARMRREVSAVGRRQSMKGQYAIYRSISAGQGGGWLHPGIKKRGLFEKAQEHLDDIIEAAMEGFADGAVS